MSYLKFLLLNFFLFLEKHLLYILFRKFKTAFTKIIKTDYILEAKHYYGLTNATPS